jgi:hypothetical protein
MFNDVDDGASDAAVNVDYSALIDQMTIHQENVLLNPDGGILDPTMLTLSSDNQSDGFLYFHSIIYRETFAEWFNTN